MSDSSGVLVGGAWLTSGDELTVLDKYNGEPVASLASANAEHVELAVAGALEASKRPPSPSARKDILETAASLVEARAASIVDRYVSETGFTIADAQRELERTVQILRLSAEEAIRISGEEVPVSATAGSENRLAFTIRVPVGVVAAISPFNAPLSTVAHKIGPAIAAGNGVVLKPAAMTPLSAIALTEAFLDAGLPAHQMHLLVGRGAEVGMALVRDDRVRYITFTGSTSVGRRIRQESGLARTHLELGSNSVSIVASDADLDLVIESVSRAGFRKAGQVCTSVQRLLVEAEVFEDLSERLAARVSKLRAGDPRDPDVDIGPMISPGEASRARSWVDAATTSGSKVIGGDLDASLLQPTLVISPDIESPLFNDEVFAPVVSTTSVISMASAIEMVNSGPYGLQTGVFTRDLDRAFDAVKRLEVGGVMVNDTSSYHADAMPYGGVKESGHGVEGPKYAALDMTDPRIVVLNLQTPA